MNDELLNLLPEKYEGLEAEPLGASPLGVCKEGMYAGAVECLPGLVYSPDCCAGN